MSSSVSVLFIVEIVNEVKVGSNGGGVDRPFPYLFTTLTAVSVVYRYAAPKSSFSFDGF